MEIPKFYIVYFVSFQQNFLLVIVGRREYRRAEGRKRKKWRKAETRELIYKYHPHYDLSVMISHNVFVLSNITSTKKPLNMSVLEHQLLMHNKI